MKSVKIEKKQPVKQAQVIDQRAIKIEPVMSADAPNHRPIRTVIYVETAGMERERVRYLINQVREHYTNSVANMYFVIPVVDGKFTVGDVVFEEEFMAVVNEICTVDESGKITLKGGPEDVQVIRSKI